MGLEIGKQTFSFPDPRLERLTTSTAGHGPSGYGALPFIPGLLLFALVNSLSQFSVNGTNQS